MALCCYKAAGILYARIWIVSIAPENVDFIVINEYQIMVNKDYIKVSFVYARTPESIQLGSLTTNKPNTASKCVIYVGYS